MRLMTRRNTIFLTLARGGDRLALSRDDGVFGTVVVVTTGDVDGSFRVFRERGLRTPGNPEAPTLVHEGPIDQSWGAREFYVEDPDRGKRNANLR
jgi:hypothetical protein